MVNYCEFQVKNHKYCIFTTEFWWFMNYNQGIILWKQTDDCRYLKNRSYIAHTPL